MLSLFKYSRKAILLRKQEEALFEIVAQELKDGFRNEGLWHRAKSLTEGDTNKTEAKYIELRFKSLKDDLIIAKSSIEKSGSHADKLKPRKLNEAKASSEDNFLTIMLLALFGMLVFGGLVLLMLMPMFR